MKDTSRSRWRETALVTVLLPLFAVLDFHIPLLASYGWRKLRVPYIIGMPVLFAFEMIVVDVLFFEGLDRAVMLLLHGALFSLVVLLSVLFSLLDDRKRLKKGPGNVEGFAPAHMIFLLTCLLASPIVQKAMSMIRAANP